MTRLLSGDDQLVGLILTRYDVILIPAEFGVRKSVTITNILFIYLYNFQRKNLTCYLRIQNI